MARQTMTDTVFALVARRRRAVADLVETLDGDQLATGSLCSGWDVRTVVGHLAGAASPGTVAPLLALVRAGLRPHVANDRLARRAARASATELAAVLRDRADSRFTPPVTGPRAPLTDVLVHEGDVRVPLGLAFDPEPEAVAYALDFVTTGRPVGFVPRGRLTGLQLVAEDLGRVAGAGQPVTGRAIDLVMAACGRAAVLPRLRGAGVDLLARRL